MFNTEVRLLTRVDLWYYENSVRNIFTTLLLGLITMNTGVTCSQCTIKLLRVNGYPISPHDCAHIAREEVTGVY